MDWMKILIIVMVFGTGTASSINNSLKKKTLIASSISASFVRGPVQLPVKSKSSRFVVVSEGQYDHDHHTHHAHDDHVKLEPHFTSKNGTIDVYLGTTATLDCTIHDVANESVSWMRNVDDKLELLTWKTNTYSKDDRYSLVQEAGEKWQRWQLVIRDAQVKDQGQYRCQVTTQPPMLLIATLQVTEPRVRVVDERGTKVLEKHYNSGSMIELKCEIECVPFPHGPVTWRRGDETLSFNTSIGGISVKGDAETGYIRSRLYVANASPVHSGVYSCWYNNYSSEVVTVHVIAGENSAAIGIDKSPEETTSSGSTISPHHYIKGLPFYCLLSVAFCTVYFTFCSQLSFEEALLNNGLGEWDNAIVASLAHVDKCISFATSWIRMVLSVPLCSR